MTTPAHESEPQESPVEAVPDAPATDQAADARTVEKPAREVDPELAARMRKLRGWLIAGFVVVAIVLVAILVWTQFLPRWWAQTIARQTGGTVSGGVGWGLIHGFVFTLIPLVLLGFAVLRQWKAPIVRFVLAGLAVVVALPNLITLSITLSPGRANEIARTTMDVNAPFFQGSVLVGAIIAGVIGAGLGVWSVIQGRRNRELAEFRAEAKGRKGRR